MRIDRIRLTDDEFRWLKRNAEKTTLIMEAAADADPKILERSTYKTLLSLTQIAPLGSGLRENENDVMLTRKQKVTMRTLIDNTVAILEDKVIPKYKKQDLQDYCLDVEEKVLMLKTMARKLR